MLGEYLPILLFLFVSTGLGIVLLVLGWGLRVLLAGADGYRPGTAAYADEGLHTHTGRGAAYNAQMAGAIRAAGLPVEFITPSEYERA